MSETTTPGSGDLVRATIEAEYVTLAKEGHVLNVGQAAWLVVPVDSAAIEVVHPATHGLTGPELYAALDDGDRSFVGLFFGCSFGGDVTLPSGRRLSGEQMASVQKFNPPGGTL